jgi:hypothetical protein
MVGMRIPAAVALLALTVVAGSASGAPQPDALEGNWNRLSADRLHPAPEHELLRCVGRYRNKVIAPDRWFCRYSKDPERNLNFYWDDTRGTFIGKDVTDSFRCPSWFSSSICANFVQVVEGRTRFTRSGAAPTVIREDYVVTPTAMYAYWPDYGFYCAWFRTWDQAVAANPFPLPFTGTWPAQDCVTSG